MRATFPFRLLNQDLTPRFVGASLEPQRAISGAETVIPTMSARWEVTASFVIRGEAAQLQWQAFLAQMEGRIGTTMVPIRTRFRPKDRNGKPAPACQTAGLGDAQTWEHFGFRNEPIATTTLAVSAPLRATTLKVTGGNTTGLRPGQFFSIGERLYRVQHHWQDADGTSNVMVQPPLRAAAPAGSALILDAPVCPMRMVSEDEGQFDQLLDRMPRVNCTFVEAV